MGVALAGFLTGLSLIVAIGAQNAYVLRLGLARQHVGLAVFICATADLLLIAAGIGGVGTVVRAVPVALEVIRWVGIVYLVGFALLSFWRARRSEVLLPSEAAPPSVRVVLASTLAFTFLNPHVYLDTVLLVGTIANQYGPQRWTFGAGAGAASILWFSALGFGARGASKVMSRPITWRVLDVGIGLVMLGIALSLVSTPLR